MSVTLPVAKSFEYQPFSLKLSFPDEMKSSTNSGQRQVTLHKINKQNDNVSVIRKKEIFEARGRVKKHLIAFEWR